MFGRRPSLTLALASVAMLLFAVGCSPSIGDSCGGSTDCDINGTRICDRAQPGGYCTIQGCDVGTCPDGEGTCVQFRSDVPRLTDSYCMYSCDSDSDCRDDEGYRCLSGEQVGAVILDGPAKFCAIPPAAAP